MTCLHQILVRVLTCFTCKLLHTSVYAYLFGAQPLTLNNKLLCATGILAGCRLNSPLCMPHTRNLRSRRWAQGLHICSAVVRKAGNFDKNQSVKLCCACAIFDIVGWKRWQCGVTTPSMYINCPLFRLWSPQAGLHLPPKSLTLNKNITQPYYPLFTSINWLCSPPRYDFPTYKYNVTYCYWFSLVDLRSFSLRLLPLQSRTGGPHHRRDISSINSRASLPRGTRILWKHLRKEA